MTYMPGVLAGPAPGDATYITQTGHVSLTNEQALFSLTTGLVKVTNGTGVLSTATAGTDYQAPLTADTDYAAPATSQAHTLMLMGA